MADIGRAAYRPLGRLAGRTASQFGMSPVGRAVTERLPPVDRARSLCSDRPVAGGLEAARARELRSPRREAARTMLGWAPHLRNIRRQ